MTEGMELAGIERELYIDAGPEIVFEVVSTPEHIVNWWTDEANFDPNPGGSGWIGFGDVAAGGKRVEFSVAEAVPYRLFSFRWTHDAGEHAAAGNSNLVTFELEPEGNGTRLRFTEVGFRERGWDDAKAANMHADHSNGWDYFLPRLVAYAAKLGAQA